MKVRKHILATTCLLLTVASAAGQRSRWLPGVEAPAEQAAMLHEAGMYGAARAALEHAYATPTPGRYRQEDRAAAATADPNADFEPLFLPSPEQAFMRALEAKFTLSPDAYNLLDDFQHYHQDDRRRDEALYHLGDLYLIAGDEKTALSLLNRVDESRVPADLRRQVLFKRGYSYFARGDHNAALAQFDKMDGQYGEYANAVKYYRAHVAYENGNLDKALGEFNDLSRDEGFREAAQYYIAQILYAKKEYREALRYSEPLTTPEMTRVTADCHFMLGEDAAALKAYQRLDKPNRADHYHMGMAQLHLKDYKLAEEHLSKVIGPTDEMAQNAHYNLAVCALQRGDKKKARTAFEAAAQTDFDRSVKSDAEFNALKLAYELRFSPFNDIVAALTEHLKKYPDTPHRDEAYQLMAQALVTTKDYPRALDALEKIEHKDLNINRALQRLAFYQALAQYNNKDYEGSQDMLARSLKYGDYDHRLKARALYWQGATLYAQQKREPARDQYMLFLQSYQASETDEFPTAHYDIAYTYYNGKQYEDARRWLLRYTSLSGDKPKHLLADAYNRLGDCLYLQRDFEAAEGYYDQALATNRAQGDYSMLQKAICLGLREDYDGKIALLDQMLKDYPKSVWADNGYFEKARAYVALGRIPEAIHDYKVVKERYPKGALASQAMLQLGLLYYNNGEMDNSLAFYKRVINEYPSTPEAHEALAGLRSVYMERNDYDGYIAYTATLGSFAHVDMQERDSLLFTAASNQMLKGNTTEAREGLSRYLDTFPQGRYVTPANYYLGECFFASGDSAQALARFQDVCEQPRSIFTEDALLRSGALLYRAQRWAEALALFARLEEEAELEGNKVEAIIGQMRCQQRLGDTQGILDGASKVLSMPQAAPDIMREAQWLKAATLTQAGRADEARPILQQLAKDTHTQEGGQAKYLLAQQLYDAGQLDEAERTIFEYVNQGTSSQYWLSRSFVLLADVYHARHDDFQAAQYLSLLREQNSDPGIERLIAQREAAWNLQAIANDGDTGTLPD